MHFHLDRAQAESKTTEQDSRRIGQYLKEKAEGRQLLCCVRVPDCPQGATQNHHFGALFLIVDKLNMVNR